MKIRFIALLVALAAGSASVLIYASRSNHVKTVPATNDAMAAAHDCSSCDMDAAKMEGCTMHMQNGTAAASLAKPEVATLANSGCPYQAGATTNACPANTATTAQLVKTTDDACCAAEVAQPAAVKPAN